MDMIIFISRFIFNLSRYLVKLVLINLQDLLFKLISLFTLTF